MIARHCLALTVWALVAVSTPAWSGVSPLSAQQPHWLGFRGDMGAEAPHGNAGELFQGNIRGEFSLLFQPRPFPPFYFGFGMSWTAFPLEEPFLALCDDLTTPETESCEPWNLVGLQLFLGAYFVKWLGVPLYAEARLIERRFRPTEYQYWPIDANQYRRATPYPEYTGWGGEGAVGLQLPLAPSTRVDLAARLGQFRPGTVVFETPFDRLPAMNGGWTLGLQLGLVWFP